MGVVFLAEHRQLARKVALKVVAPELSADQRFRDRFLRESRIAAMLDHPNVVTIYDAGSVGDLLFIAMRYVAGTDLATVLRQHGPLEPDRALRLVAKVGNALDAAHENELVHRDVKPSNVLIAEGGGERVYLTDFGLSKRIASMSGLTATNEILGTTLYMAPEQFQGHHVDGRADIYALGCVLYECLTGEPPFVRDDAAALLYAHLLEPPPAASMARRGVPPTLDEVVATAMAKNREDRYPTCALMLAAARAALSDFPAAAPPEDAAPTEAAPAPLAPTIAATPEPTIVESEVAAAAVPPPTTALTPPTAAGDATEVASSGRASRELSAGATGPPPPEEPAVVPAGDGGSRRRRFAAGIGATGVVLGLGAAIWIVSAGGGVAVQSPSTSPTASPPATSASSSTESSPVASATALVVADEDRPIVFYSDRDGDYEIYLHDVATGEERQVTDNTFHEQWPVLSPDGGRIAFARETDGQYDVWVADTDGGNERRLTDTPEDDFYPSWSPGGGTIIFVSERENADGDLHVMDADGTDQRLLVALPGWERNPLYSPDGSRIAFWAEVDGNRDVFLARDDGTEVIRLSTQAGDDRNPSWAPNGRALAYASDLGGSLDIYAVFLDVTGLGVERAQVQLTSDPLEEGSPTWSPDGEWIAFHRGEGSEFHVWAMRADGSEPRRLTTTSGARNFDPSWR